jgi:hypothetical protein
MPCWEVEVVSEDGFEVEDVFETSGRSDCIKRTGELSGRRQTESAMDSVQLAVLERSDLVGEGILAVVMFVVERERRTKRNVVVVVCMTRARWLDVISPFRYNS